MKNLVADRFLTRRTAPLHSRHQPGFALVATISIMVLLALLVVGLLSLSTVATRSSNRAASIQEARANARLALTMALGELQRTLGPDRAISAPAGIGMLESSELALGSNSPKLALRNYVGVWEAARNPRDENGKFTFEEPVYPTNGQTGDELFSGWLVSNANPDKIQQENFLDGASSADDINFDTVTVRGEATASSENPIYLVHDGSVENESGYIKAGTVPIIKSGSGNDTKPGGRYAFWVGDNNQKKLINTRDDELRYDTADGGDLVAKMATPGPYGIEAFSTLLEQQGGFEIEANTIESDRVITFNELELLEGVERDTLRRNFHDLTTVADSVLANVTSGSLRKDLSLFFEGEPTSGEWGGYALNGNAPTGPYGQEALSNYDEFDTAPWSRLRQFARLSQANPVLFDERRGAVVAPDALNASDFRDEDYPSWNRQRVLLAPVITRASMILAVGATDINDMSAGQFRRPIAEGNYPPKFNGLVPVLDTNVRENDPRYPVFKENNYLLNFSSYPVVTIWNPYNLPMSVPGLWIRFEGTGTEQIVQVEGAPNPVSYHWAVAGQSEAGTTSRSAGRGLYYDRSFTLDPGETRTFAADISGPPNFSRSLFFEARELRRPSDLEDLITESPPWNGGFLYNAPDKTANADHDNRDFYNDPNVAFSLMGSTTGIFADASSLIDITTREFLPVNQDGVDRMPDNPSDLATLGHQGLLNYSNFSSFEVQLFTSGGIGDTPYWLGWNRNPNSSKLCSFVGWRMDENGPVTAAGDLGTGPFQIPPFQMSLITNGTRRPFLSIDLRLKSPEISGDTNRTFNPNCNWLHNIPNFGINGITDHGTKRSLGGGVGDDQIRTAAMAHPYTMRFFSTPNYTDFFTTVHPMERYDGYMVSYQGRSYSGSGGSDSVGQRRMVAAEVPIAPLQSIAQYAHLPMLPIDASRWSDLALQNLAVGNSYANPLLEADSIIFPPSHPSNPTSESWQGWRTFLDLQQNNASPPWGGYADLDGVKWHPIHATTNYNDQMPPIRFVDRSYIANTLLWDDFYFSGLAGYESRMIRNLGGQIVSQRDMIDSFVNDGDNQLPNTTYALANRGIEKDQIVSELEGDDGYLKAAAHMKVSGGFNINSLSVKAWKAFLASNLKRRVPVISANGRPQRDAFEEAGDGEYEISRFTLPVETGGDPETAWVDYNVVTDEQLTDLAEKIVAEIAERGPFRSIGEFINRRVEDNSTNSEFTTKGALQAALDKSAINEELVGPGNMITASDVSGTSYGFPEAAQQSRYAGTPEYVMQSDILRSIGPAIQARSDSFTIRAFGESSDGQAKVWCEAQVTRSIDFVDPGANLPEDTLENLNSVNERFGRRFRIVSFRWLDQSEV